MGKPVEEVCFEDWRAIFDVNVNAAFATCAAAAPSLKACGGGRVINIASGAGLKRSLTGIQAYCAAKHALCGLTKQLAHELGPHGCTVNAVAPGFARTNPASDAQWHSYGEEGQRAMLGGISMRRLVSELPCNIRREGGQSL